ncbi:MAG TPA: diaminopimelate epimerase [Capsulimonadaceae bacterium]|jgi:diaminopimelate epimerase
MQFTKMHGIGNDFIMVAATGSDGANLLAEAQARAVELCDRKFGVGADGVILVLPASEADFTMRMFNPDGSEAEMCGNGIRCFAKFAYDKGLTTKTTLDVITGAGRLTTRSNVVDGQVSTVEVDMGVAHLERRDIPADLGDGRTGPIVNQPLSVGGQDWNITCVSMGNPHCVVFVDDVASFPLEKYGPQFEKNKAFPRRTNTEFVQVLGPAEVRMRVWERGAAETLACGTGACAVAVSSALSGYTGRDVVVHLAGGDLSIQWLDNGRVIMTGTATTVYEGTV